jgi:hypothetical protein
MLDLAECSNVFPFMMFHLSFFQIYFHSYLAYLISDISVKSGSDPHGTLNTDGVGVQNGVQHGRSSWSGEHAEG